MKKLFIIVIIILFASPLYPSAENQTTGLKMEELAIQVMPEYSYHPKDTEKKYPPLLIGYQGTYLNQSKQAQKGKIEIPLPKNQKNIRIGFVADYSSDLSELHELEYELDQKRGIVSWQTSTEILPNDLYKFVIEFYSDDIKEKSGSKKFEYTFISFTDIPLVNITFLEPLKTESTRLLPKPESHQENPYGMNMFLYQIAGMKMGEELTYEMTYKRTSSKTTVEMMNQIDGNEQQKPIKEKKVAKNELYLVIASIGAISFFFALLIILFFKYKKQTKKQLMTTKDSNPTTINAKAQLRNKLIKGEISNREYDQLIKKKHY